MMAANNNAGDGVRAGSAEPVGQALAASLREWLRQCPAIAGGRRFGADYLADGESYALDTEPSPIRFRENILGEYAPESRQEQSFAFASREPYGADFRQNVDNLGFFSDVADWIMEQNAARNFPEWEGGEVTAVVPALSAHPSSTGSAYARYQMQIRVIYRIRER